jgi:hypothetical protein
MEAKRIDWVGAMNRGHYAFVNRKIRFAFLIVIWGLSLPASAYELGVNVHGLSYHPDRADSNGRPFDSFNPGLGARFVVSESKRHLWLSEVGIYKNSSGHTSKYLGAGYRLKLPAGFIIGPSLAVYQSPDQNSGNAFLAPLLVLSWRYHRVLFHIVPVPRYKDVNRNAAVGLYMTVNLWKSKAAD